MFDFSSGWSLLAQSDAAETVKDAVTKVADEAGDVGTTITETTNQVASGQSGWTILIVLFVVFVLPLLVGSFIARAMKLKQYGTKIGTVLMVLIAGLAPFAWQISQGNQWTDAIKLGIDLAGGTNLVYQIDVERSEADGKPVTTDLVDRMVGAIRKRLDPANQEQITVQRVGTSRIEIIIPGADAEVVEQKKRLIHKLGNLEFAILANQRDHRDIIAQANEANTNSVRQGGQVVAQWVPVALKADGTPKDVEEFGEVVTREVPVAGGAEGQTIKEFLCIIDPPERKVTGKFLTQSRQGMGENGELAVNFTLNTEGGNRFSALTSQNTPLTDGFKRRLAILLDGRVHSAPGLNSTISYNGQITGDFSQAELTELINVLNAGALDAPIVPDPINEVTVGPTLGQDVQEKGKWAVVVATLAVVIFMLVYYRFAGLVADLCLLLNLILVLGVMSLVSATFTLPGLAGIVLTIGMAVDANVLIFERMREERARGASFRMAIQNGFGKATSTIVDANLTTLITAVVLFVIGTDQVRGFAVSLFIGIVASMFSALYFGRLVFEVCERKGIVKDFNASSVTGKTSWDFLKGRKIAAFVSIILMIIGLSSFFSRGEDNLDIDFTGGTMITFQFDGEDPDVDTVRNVLNEELGSGIVVEQLTVGEETEEADARRMFRLRTKEQNVANVRTAVSDALKKHELKLRYVSLEYSALQEVAAVEDAKSEDENRFAGGHAVDLTFSGEIPTTTLSDSFVEQLDKIQNEGRRKYDQASALVDFEGTSGSGIEAAEGTMRRYDKMTLRVTGDVEKADVETALAGLKTTMATNPIFEELNTFAGSVASEMQVSAIQALVVSLLAIIAYIWFRFQRITFGFAAVVALVHDVTIVLGLVAIGSTIGGTEIGKALLLEDFKINLPMIAAFLTIVGYSLNDTIVVFDRIREVRGKNPALTDDMVNMSLNQTLSRTILTSLTTLIVVVILYVGGGEGIHGFAFCLVMGVIVGTYSSIYVASPVLLWLMNRPGSETARATVATQRVPST